MGTLSLDAQRNLARLKIRPGSIIKVFCDFICDPKYKYCVIVHTDYGDNLFLLFLVNSKIANFIKNNPEMLWCQIPLLHDEYAFLPNTVSHLDCAEVQDQLSVNDALDHLIKVPDDYCGELKIKDIEEVIRIVRDTTTINPIDKGLIIQSLQTSIQ